MMEQSEGIYGLLAEFATPEELVAAVRQARLDGWRRMDCYSPYPLEEAAEAMHCADKSVALITLIGGVLGLVAVSLLEVWASVYAYPMNVGGRPAFSWPAFVVPAFEGTILCAGLSAGLGMLALNGFPQIYHPLFHAESFCDGATTDKFFLCLEARDPKFDLATARIYLESLDSLAIAEVAL